MDPNTQPPNTNQPTTILQQPAAPAPPQSAVPGQQVPTTTPPAKKSRKKLFIITGAAAVVVAAILVIAFMIGSSTVNDWLVKNNIVNKTNAIKQDILNIGQDGEQQNTSRLLTDCKKAANDAKTLQAIPAGPNSELNSELSNASKTIFEGASKCVSSINNDSSADLTSAIEQVISGTNELATFTHNASIFLK